MWRMMPNSSEMPLPPSMSRATRAMSSDLPQELRFMMEVISTAAVPSSFMRPRRRQPCRPSVISVCMSASFFWMSWLAASGRPNCLRSSTYWRARCQQNSAPEEGFEKTIKWLLAAKAPAIVADWVGRREAGFNALVELAELLAIPVLDQFGRFNFPVKHPLNLTGMANKVLGETDLLLVLDVPDLEGGITQRAQEAGRRRPIPILSSSAKIINVGLDDLLVRAWSHDFNKLREVDLSIMADTSAFLPELVRRLKAEKESLKKNASAISQRRDRWAKLHAEREENLAREILDRKSTRLNSSHRT